jgi:hypothetical protein
MARKVTGGRVGEPSVGAINVSPTANFTTATNLDIAVSPAGTGIRQTMNIDFNGDPNYKFNVPSSGGASYN